MLGFGVSGSGCRVEGLGLRGRAWHFGRLVAGSLAVQALGRYASPKPLHPKTLKQ